jgi:thioredoxin reductase (NADPH)
MDYDIVVIGGGTAGMTAAIYAKRAGKSVILLEQEGIGGQIVTSPNVENYPGIKQISGIEFAEALYTQASDLGAEIAFEKAESVTKICTTFEIKTDMRTIAAKSVIIATGAKSRPLGVAKESELTGRGVSYCAVCDGAFFKGKDVAVIGGGSTALQDAQFLSAYCSKVYLVHRRDEFRGEEKTVAILREKENVEFVLSHTVEEIKGESSVTGIAVKSVKTGEISEISLSGIFVAVGQIPRNDEFKDLVELDSYGYVKAGEDCVTSTPGVFTAGDCRTKEVRQLTTAAADGAVAALAACQYAETV